MVTTRRESKRSSDLTQQTNPRRSPKTDIIVIAPLIDDLSPKDSTAAIANDSAAQSSPEPSGPPEPHSDNANGIIDMEVDTEGITINAETQIGEESATNVSEKDVTQTWSAINGAETVPSGSAEPSPIQIVPGDVSYSSVKEGHTLSTGPHLSKEQQPTKRQKTIDTKDGRSATHAQSLEYTPEADSSLASPSPSSERYPAFKKPKSLLKRKRLAAKHVTVCDNNSEENQYKRCKKTAFEAQVDKENLWMDRSMGYILEAAKYNDTLSKLYDENAVSHKKQRNEVEKNSGRQRKAIKDQGDVLERCINYIVLCGARELKYTRRWGGI